MCGRCLSARWRRCGGRKRSETYARIVPTFGTILAIRVLSRHRHRFKSGMRYLHSADYHDMMLVKCAESGARSVVRQDYRDGRSGHSAYARINSSLIRYPYCPANVLSSWTSIRIKRPTPTRRAGSVPSSTRRNSVGCDMSRISDACDAVTSGICSSLNKLKYVKYHTMLIVTCQRV